jgi:hypothetical protein
MKKQIFKISCAALALSIALVSCKKKEVEEKLPEISGYKNSNEVAAANLVAYWDMEGSGKETKSGAMPDKILNATFVDGAKGKAVSLASGYMSFGEIAALNSLPNVTVSAWVKVSNNKTSPSLFFTLTRPSSWAGNINFFSETGWRPASSDTLVLKGLIVSQNSFQDTINDASKGGNQAPKVAGKWAHVVMTWNGSDSMFRLYADGKKVSNPEWEQRGSTGPLSFVTPTRAIIGAWGSNLSGTPESWQVPMTGLIDELRVYSKALSDSEISSLHQLESAGR